MSVSYKIASSIPGRIRLKVPRLCYDFDYAVYLEASVKSLSGIKEVNINSTAGSILVKYDPNIFSKEQIESQLALAIKEATNPDRNQVLSINFAGYKALSLSAYEYIQLEHFRQWYNQEPSLLSGVTDGLLSPFKSIVDKAIPAPLLQQMLELFETATGSSQQQWEEIKLYYEGKNYQQLKKVSLQQCDRLAERVRKESIARATLEGGITGIFGVLGELANVGWSIHNAIKTIHQTGLCYGYPTLNETEKIFSWVILDVATSHTKEQRHRAIKTLHNIQNILYQKAIKDVVEESLLETIEDNIIEKILERVIQNLVEEEGEEIIPVIGIGIGISNQRKTIEQISITAQKSFQIRWLLENNKIISNTPK